MSEADPMMRPSCFLLTPWSIERALSVASARLGAMGECRLLRILGVGLVGLAVHLTPDRIWAQSECNPVIYEADCVTRIDLSARSSAPERRPPAQNNRQNASAEWPCGAVYPSAQQASRACGPGVEVLRIWTFFGARSRGWTCNCLDYSRQQPIFSGGN